VRNEKDGPDDTHLQPSFMTALGCFALLGCILFGLAILIADFVVPHHDWIADTISDLGAGKYEFIVDIGIYAFAASLISIALLAAHDHLGGLRWSFGAVGFAVLGLIVFLVGARNEYGDNDSDGWVIPYLPCLCPWPVDGGLAMGNGARRRPHQPEDQPRPDRDECSVDHLGACLLLPAQLH
jgi:hypothetical protein